MLELAFSDARVKDGKVDDGQVEELRRWAAGLAKDGRPEVRAAAKAILLLSEDLLATRSQLLEERMILEALEGRLADEDELAAGEEELAADLRGRLRALLHLRRRQL
jgi:hypothetical protein